MKDGYARLTLVNPGPMRVVTVLGCPALNLSVLSPCWAYPRVTLRTLGRADRVLTARDSQKQKAQAPDC